MTTNDQTLEQRNEELTRMLINSYQALSAASDFIFKQPDCGGLYSHIGLVRDMAFELLSKEKSYREIKG